MSEALPEFGRRSPIYQLRLGEISLRCTYDNTSVHFYWSRRFEQMQHILYEDELEEPMRIFMPPRGQERTDWNTAAADLNSMQFPVTFSRYPRDDVLHAWLRHMDSTLPDTPEEL